MQHMLLFAQVAINHCARFDVRADSPLVVGWVTKNGSRPDEK